MTANPTQVNADFQKLIDASETQLGYLYGRWQDEKKYENFDDYVDEMKKLVKEPFTFSRATTRPFAMIVKHKDVTNFEFHITRTARELRFGPVKK